MSTSWTDIAILRLASLLAPSEERARWIEEWRSELWYIPRSRATFFCLGAFRDAFCVRQIQPRGPREARIQSGSPFACLAFLVILAAVGIAIAVELPLLQLGPWPSPIPIRKLLMAYAAMLLVSALASPAIFLTMPRSHANVGRLPCRVRLRSASFLLGKVVLLQPALLCVFVFCIAFAPLAYFAPYLLCASWILALRWIFRDQCHRCPICLRLLTPPVRIGTPSRTFLEPYADGSMCSRGHGLLHAGGASVTYAERARWLSIDGEMGRLP